MKAGIWRMGRLIVDTIEELLRRDRVNHLMKKDTQFYLRKVTIFKSKIWLNEAKTIPESKLEIIGVRECNLTVNIQKKVTEVMDKEW